MTVEVNRVAPGEARRSTYPPRPDSGSGSGGPSRRRPGPWVTTRAVFVGRQLDDPRHASSRSTSSTACPARRWHLVHVLRNLRPRMSLLRPRHRRDAAARFPPRKAPPGAGPQLGVGKRPDRHPHQPLHRVPMRWNISRTSWVLPSPTTTRQNEFMPLGVVRTWPPPWARCVALEQCAALQPSTSLGSGTPFTLAMYSRSTPYRG